MYRYQILNGSEMYDADQFAQTAALVFDMPIVIAALNERYRSWYHCVQGVAPADFDRLQTFCAHAHLSDTPFIVRDVRDDSFFSGEQAVIRSPHVAFFAGAPLRDPEGKRFGTLCLADRVARDFTAGDQTLLESFAELVSQDICLRSAGRYAVRDLIDSEQDKCTLFDMAMTDPLTKTLNRRAFYQFAEREVMRSRRHGLELSALMLDIDHFKQVNDIHGHAVGDAVLKGMIRTISENIRDEDLLGRLGGEEFAIVLPETCTSKAAVLADRLRKAVKRQSFPSPHGAFNISISIGISNPGYDDIDIGPALERADKAVYQAKRDGRDRVNVAPYKVIRPALDPSENWVLRGAAAV
ncbi:sensor domain-containing diguanylate cyclase [Hyphomonas johnsonii]|uniref:diguanylate cyclase n=1 Tax=Hyphomonas johnsonii MHS-2 TaxID=1280950 RepID=A0A059FNL9_9PROT|nr:sensor domain-containing diguanylate cyclase [Hyphomonas johnsonii]KCZ92244.1 diguanylate cyclase [Hyphomonas johnsonii MHS-2]